MYKYYNSEHTDVIANYNFLTLTLTLYLAMRSSGLACASNPPDLIRPTYIRTRLVLKLSHML